MAKVIFEFTWLESSEGCNGAEKFWMQRHVLQISRQRKILGLMIYWQI